MPRAVHQATPHKHKPRGDGSVKQYAATYQLGETTVHIDDTYAAKTPEEQARVDEQIRAAVMAIFEEVAEREAAEREKAERA